AKAHLTSARATGSSLRLSGCAGLVVAQAAGPDDARVQPREPVGARDAVVVGAEPAINPGDRCAQNAAQLHAAVGCLDPDRTFRGVQTGPCAAAHGDRQARSRGSERENGVRAPGRVERVGDRVGELPAVAAGGSELLEQVKQTVGSMTVLEAA